MNAVPSKNVIEDVALELGIDAAFVEKDWYVVQLVREIISIQNSAAKVFINLT